MCPPVNALVSIVNGKASIAAQAHPINKKERNNTYLSWIKNMEINPIPPKMRLNALINLRFLNKGIMIAHKTEPIA